MATAQDILRLTGIESNTERELTTRESPDFSARPREQLNELKNLTIFHAGLRETNGIRLSDPYGEDRSPEGMESAKDGKGVVAAPLTRTYSGVECQWARTERGTKIYINLQRPDMQSEGTVIRCTAELKSYTRLREIKSNKQDDDYFQQFVTVLVEQSRQPAGAYSVGRIHERKTRSQWYQNAIVRAHWHEKKIELVEIWLESERYEVTMNLPLTDRQTAFYWSAGRWGEIRQNRQVKTLAGAQHAKY